MSIPFSLAKYIGDVPAIQTTKILKKIKNTGKKNLQDLTGSLVEFWQEENQILAKKRDVEKLNNNIDIIVEDTERLEARIKNITEKRKV